MAFFASDNTSAVSPEIMTALEKANKGYTQAYGADYYTTRLTKRFREIFEHPDLLVFPVFNGSAANGAALASIVRPYQAVICHKHSHLQQDECGLPELFTGGKLLGVGGEGGKINLDEAAALFSMAKDSGVHHALPKAISISQSTESGTVYLPEEIKKISTWAKKHKVSLHMDGARFANAVASLGCLPADISWKAGVDVLSFGGTKNGAMMAEAIIFFKPELAEDFPYIRKRCGQLASKQRYISAQLLALMENGLWLKNAFTSNTMARLLKQRLEALDEIKLLASVEANAVFVEMSKAMAEKLMEKGHHFCDWPLLGENAYRLVTSFTTTQEDVENFIKDCSE
jgi:threonine aldolase